MEPLYRISTRYHYRMFRQFSWKTKQIGRWILIWTFCVAGICLLALLFHYLFTGIALWQYLIPLPVALLLLLCGSVVYVRRIWSLMPFAEEGEHVEETVFFEDRLELTDEKGRREIPYDEFWRLIPAGRYLYLMFSAYHGIIVDTGGSGPALEVFLTERIGAE